jgi:hypothetical protein
MARLKEDISAFFKYLSRKKSDVSRMDESDALLAKVVLDIHRKRTSTDMVFVPLRTIRPIHPVDRGIAAEDVSKRAETVAAHQDEVLETRRISKEYLAAYIPSVSHIKIVEIGPNDYVSFEGNGRLEALRRVFGQETDVTVEVEQYVFRPSDRTKIARRVNRVRRWNGVA